MKNNNGITLIALVITIIVLLILAGVSIAMLSGDNSILNQAQNAASENEIAAQKEAAVLELDGVIAEWYEAYYAKSTTTQSKVLYIANNYETSSTDGYTVEVVGTEEDDEYTAVNSITVTISADSSVTGTIDTNGTLSWN